MRLSLWKGIVTLVLLVLSLGLKVSQAYTLNITDEGRQIKWKNPNQRIVINSTSSRPGFHPSIIEGIINDSLQQWNSTSSAIQLTGAIDRLSSPRERVNNLYFSNSHQFLGSNVAGVTITVSDIATGEILESDIIINDSLSLSLTPGSDYYLGDIVTHELGHFIGLAHSQVQFSSMFYRLNKSQNKVSSDDRAGARALYQSNTDAKIRGRVIGGASRTGIFGAHVQAISLHTGEIRASVISAPDGRFTINGLSHEDQYYLYVDRLDALDTLPTFYREVKSNFCQSARSYRGSFFQTCFSRDVGFPQVLRPNAGSTLDIGEVTIRCGLDVPIDYIAQKPATDFELNVERKSSGVVNIGESMVGFFSKSEVDQNIYDSYHFTISPDFFIQEGTGRDLYLEVKATSQALYSPLRIETRIERADGYQVHSRAWNDIEVDARFRPVLDSKVYMPLDGLQWSNNSFELRVTPHSLDDVVASTVYGADDLFPDIIRFIDELPFYLLTIHVVEQVAAGVYIPISSKKLNSLNDNKLCPDAPLSYSVDSTRMSGSFSDGGIRGSASSSDSSNDPLSLGCGTIDLRSGGGGPGGMPLLLLSSIGFMILLNESKKPTKS